MGDLPRHRRAAVGGSLDTGLVDITGAGGLLVQVNGRAAQPVIDWLAAATSSGKPGSSWWRSTCRRPTPRPPGRRCHMAADRRSVPPGQKSGPDARTRCVAAPLRRIGCGVAASGRGADQPALAAARGRAAHRRATPQTVRTAHVRGPQRRHRRRLDHQRLLRDALACTARGGLHYEISATLYAFYTFCAAVLGARDPAAGRNDLQLAGTNVLAIQTGLSNARSEGYNRIVNTSAASHSASGRPENQRRRATVGLHPPITASAIQHQTAAPLLTRMSRLASWVGDTPTPVGFLSEGVAFRQLSTIPATPRPAPSPTSTRRAAYLRPTPRYAQPAVRHFSGSCPADRTVFIRWASGESIMPP